MRPHTGAALGAAAMTLASTVFGLSGTAGAAPPPDVAAPAGWQLIASTDFPGTSLGAQWGAYGGSYGIGSNAWSPSEVSVSGGMLHVRFDRLATGGKPFTSGGAAMWNLSQTYGRYEFKAKAPATDGIDSYVTLWPPDSDSDSEATLVELLAKPAVSPGLEAAYVTIGYGSDKATATVPGHYTDRFHDYVIEWTPDHESVSVDGVVLLSSPHVTKSRRWIGFITSSGDTLTGSPSASTRLPAEFEIENLRIYAYAPGAGGTATTTPPASHSSQTSAKPSHTSSTAGRTPTPTKSATATASKPTVTSASPATTPTASALGPASISATAATVVADSAAAAKSSGSNPAAWLLALLASAVATALIGVWAVRRRRG